MVQKVPASMTEEGLTVASVAATAAAAATAGNVKLTGDVVQVVNTQTGALATGTTVLPWDDTIPQIGEGIEFMTLAITPVSATNILVIEVVGNFSASVAQNFSVALFQDATANALAAAPQFMASTGSAYNVKFIHKMTAGTTSATTFRVRAGGNNAGTTTFNGVSGGRYLGGVMASSITITEIKA